MTIKVEYEDTGATVIVAPAGEHGYGTIGQADPAGCFARAWRELQRAGMTKAVDETTRRLVSRGQRVVVEYTVPDADAYNRIPAKYF